MTQVVEQVDATTTVHHMKSGTVVKVVKQEALDQLHQFEIIDVCKRCGKARTAIVEAGEKYCR